MKLTQKHKIFYAENKLKLEKTVNVHELIQPVTFERDRKHHNAWNIIKSNYRRKAFKEFLSQLQAWKYHGMTPEIRTCSRHLLSQLRKRGIKPWVQL